METIFINTSNSATNKSNEFLYKFIEKLDLKNPNKTMALANVSIYYTRKNIKSSYNNNKFKISARPHGMKHLIYQMDRVRLKRYRIVLTTS